MTRLGYHEFIDALEAGRIGQLLDQNDRAAVLRANREPTPFSDVLYAVVVDQFGRNLYQAFNTGGFVLTATRGRVCPGMTITFYLLNVQENAQAQDTIRLHNLERV